MLKNILSKLPKNYLTYIHPIHENYAILVNYSITLTCVIFFISGVNISWPFPEETDFEN